LLTEQQIERDFRRLFSDTGSSSDAFERADELISQLRPESPLRHRLDVELDELRRLADV